MLRYRLIDVRPQVGNVLQPDGHANGAAEHRAGGALIRGEVEVIRQLEDRLDAAQARGDRSERQSVRERARRVGSAANHE